MAGRGRIILRSATHLTELFRLTNLGSEDYRNLLHMLQTENPVFWDSEGRLAAHRTSADA